MSTAKFSEFKWTEIQFLENIQALPVSGDFTGKEKWENQSYTEASRPFRWISVTGPAAYSDMTLWLQWQFWQFQNYVFENNSHSNRIATLTGVTETDMAAMACNDEPK